MQLFVVCVVHKTNYVQSGPLPCKRSPGASLGILIENKFELITR